MCNNLVPIIDEKEVQGFKVIAIKEREEGYFSVAMGFKYPAKGIVPVPDIQVPLSPSIHPWILDSDDHPKMANSLFIPDMVGRTAVFLNKVDAEEFKEDIRYTYWSKGPREKISFLVVEALVSSSLMKGDYEGGGVVAGKFITFPSLQRSEEGVS